MGILEVLGLQDLAAYEAYKKKQKGAGQDLSKMLMRTGRSGQVSTLADAGARETEQQSFDKDRDGKRSAHLSAVYSKTEIAFNQRQMESGFAGKQKTANTPQYREAVALARGELDTVATRENLRRSLSAGGREKLTDNATDAKVEADLARLIDRKAADALGVQYGAKITNEVKTLYAVQLTHPPTDAEMQTLIDDHPNEFNGYMQAALASLEETDSASTGRVGLAHYDSRHTKPGEADMLGRVGSAVSPDLKQKSAGSGDYGATVTETTATGPVTRIVPTPAYAGQAGTGAMPAGMTVSNANRRRERQTNKVSTVKSAEAGLFLIEDAMAQAWEQAFLDDTAQNVGAENHNLTYEFGGYREPMAYEGGLGDTYETTGVGLGANHATAPALTRFDKIKSRLDNVTLTRDNPGAKVLLKQDKSRAGYDPFTMYSQLTTGTGMMGLKRAPSGGGAPGAVLMAGNYADLAPTNWEAAGKKHAATVAQATTLQKTEAAAGVADATLKLTNAEGAGKLADTAYDDCVKQKFGGQAQDNILKALTGVVSAEATRDELTALLVEANALLASAVARIGPITAGLGTLPPTDKRVVDIQASLAADRKKCEDQVTAVNTQIVAVAKELADAQAALAQSVTDSGKTMTDPAIVDLLAKGRAKTAAAADLGEAQALVKAADSLLAKATEDERQAKADQAQIDAGGFEAFLTQTLTAGAAQAKAELEGAIASAATPEARAGALSDALAKAESEREKIQDQRSGVRLAALEKSSAAFEAAGKTDDDAAERLKAAKAAHQKLVDQGSPADTVALYKLIADAEQEAADAAAEARKKVEAFEADRRAAIWDQVSDDEAEDLRAEADALHLAADVGIAKGAGTPQENAAREDLAAKLGALQTILKDMVKAGGEERTQRAAVSALTTELARVKAQLAQLEDARMALGFKMTGVLVAKIGKAATLESKVEAALVVAQQKQADAVAERAKQEALADPARDAVEAAREVLEKLAPAPTTL